MPPAPLDLGDDVLQLLRDLEDRDAARRNRHRLPGARIARESGLPVLHLERPEASDFNVLPLREGARHRLEKLIHRVSDVLLRQAGPFGNLVYDLRLGYQPLLSRPKPARVLKLCGQRCAIREYRPGMDPVKPFSR